MSVAVEGEYKAGLVGPAALLGGALLLVAAPIVRASDYFYVLIGIEFIALAILVALATRAAVARTAGGAGRPFDPLVACLLAAPLVIGIVQLTPLPIAWWNELPGHARYVQALGVAGIAQPQWRPATLSPDATLAALLAGLPLVAAFLLGYLGSLRQVRLLLRVVAVMAFGEVLLGLLQLSGGEHSPWYFGMLTYGAPIGSLGTRNEYANLLGMALCAYAWLAYDAMQHSTLFQPYGQRHTGALNERHALAAWVVGGLVLAVGILISRSRAGALFGLSAAAMALVAAGLRVSGATRGWRVAVAGIVLVLVGAVAMLGLDPLMSRGTGEQLRSAAGFRGDLARSSWDAALAYFPLGSGWGTYDTAYRPFQPRTIVGYPNHAHMDYVEMFVEGGLLFLVFAACFAIAALRRAGRLLATAWRERTLEREAMMAALCGIALLGFLLHAAVDFPMRIPANAILACLLAGVFLRPLGRARPAS